MAAKELESKQNVNAGISRVVAELSRTEVNKYQNTISGTSGHRSSTAIIVGDLQGMTSY